MFDSSIPKYSLWIDKVVRHICTVVINSLVYIKDNQLTSDY